MPKRFVLATLPVLALLAALPATADEGLWLPNQFPTTAVARKYGFRATPGFLRHLQLAAVRFNNGGTGSFVSADGLLFTNHHVGADCVQKISTPEHDYIKEGFLAASRADERSCPDLEVNVLLSTTEVTARVTSGIGAQTSPAEAAKLRRSNVAAIEKECNAKTGNRCDVVTLFAGARYDLYEYKKYTDIRLAMAPEFSLAFFGGDPENFTYPRFDLDITFFRAYENGQPAKPADFFRFSKTGAHDGDLIFTSGNPGTTGRLNTVAQLEFLRDTDYPLRLRRMKALNDVLQGWSATSAEHHREAQEVIFGIQNSYKAYSGFLRGLRDASLMDSKRAAETKLRAAVAADAKIAADGAAWEQIAGAFAGFRPNWSEYYFLEGSPALGSSLFSTARRVVRYAAERAKPNGERLREFSDSNLPAVEQAMYSTAPIHPELEVEALTEYFRSLVEEFGAAHPLVASVLDGKSPREAAASYVNRSKLIDVVERRRLAVSAEAVANSDDGMIRLVLKLDPRARELRKIYDEQLDGVLQQAAAKISRARYAVSGGTDYPDATFTLRFSYGQVKGYRNAAGAEVPWATDFAGLYAKYTGADPYDLPRRWVDAKSKLNLKMPFDYAATADIHGGNSGSATLNAKGEITGIVFDSNIEALPNRFVYRDGTERSVHVATQAIVEALTKVYGAKALLQELGF
jgi:hypothetical protein